MNEDNNIKKIQVQQGLFFISPGTRKLQKPKRTGSRKVSILLKTLGISIILFLTHPLFSQSNNFTQNITIVVPEVLMVNAVDATGSPNAVPLEMGVPANAGDMLQRGLATSFIQVSSIIVAGQNHKIQASYDQIPDGTYLKVTGILPSSGNGEGTFGASTGKVTLTTTSQDLITGIGSCYTGIAPGDGYQLNWVLNYKSYSTYYLIKAVTGFTATIVITIAAGG